ncbi:MAG: transketolase [Candidatus Aminicenantes bacterium]|nr:transketolase [Candidatus Aminicenantes bacterium]
MTSTLSDDALAGIAKRLRAHSLRMTTAAGSGHPTTCLSMAEIAAVLFFQAMRWNPRDPEDWGNDELVLSKGHAAPILWAAYAEAGVITPASLLNLRKISSELEGHPTPRMKWIKAATGSLGQGLSVGVGMAAAQRLGGSPGRVFVVMGDGECAEGSVWEGANAAAHLRLTNLCAIVDVNRLGQSGPTMHEHGVAAYARKFEAFGWAAVVIDGHDIDSVSQALAQAGRTGAPLAVIAKTLKGKGVSFLEDQNGWHGRPLKPEELERALAEIGPLPEGDAAALITPPPAATRPEPGVRFDFPRTAYAEKTATRLAYGKALAALGGVNSSIVAIDGDVKNSTYADKFFEAFPARSFQSYIAEQNMIGMGMGFAAKGYIPFMATFAAFLTRAHDQVRMAAYSYSNIKVCGSHVGVSIGEDGASQMGLEDIALFRSVPGCVVLYPGDAVSAEACVEAAARHRGPVYIRASRPATALLYGPGETFPIGGSKILRHSAQDAVSVIAAGITLHEALKAADELAAGGIAIRVLDAYSVQPLDVEGLRAAVSETGNLAVVVEDHYEAGGLGEAVASALAGRARIRHLCVRELPRSGKPEELLDRCGINARAVVAAVKELMA